MAVIKLGGGTIQVRYVTHLTTEDNKVIRKNVKGIAVLHLSDIKVVDNYFNPKGDLDMEKCRIFHETYNEMVHLKMDGTMRVTGFQQKYPGRYKQPKQTKTKINGKPKPTKRNSRNPRKNA
jgi:hypothetical protein